MARRLTETEITKLARRPGVDIIEVENFLGTMLLHTGAEVNMSCMQSNAWCYHWNEATQYAIELGIRKAFK